jgi:regulator of nucleoside diphosphate kinase
MQNNQNARGRNKPAIYITEADYDVIAGLALQMEARAPDLSGVIMSEINRAKVCAPGRMPDNVVRMGSEVTFLDKSSDTTRKVRLVLPGEADIEQGRISVLTPVGAGLIGMRVDSEINWPCPDGRARVLKILQVTQTT